MTKGRYVAHIPMQGTKVNGPGPLTLEAFEAALKRVVEYRPMPSLDPRDYQRLPEPSPFERGVLDRYQDRRIKHTRER